MEGVECSLYGEMTKSIVPLRERLVRMGGVISEGNETHLIFSPISSEGIVRTSALLHVLDDGDCWY